MKRWAINVPIFDIEVEIVLGDNLGNIATYIEDAYDCSFMDAGLDTVAATYDVPNGPIVIALTCMDKWFVLHECLHAVWKIFKRKGIEDEETFCYLAEWLYKEVYILIDD